MTLPKATSTCVAVSTKSPLRPRRAKDFTMPLTLEIVTPEARVYSDTIDSVVVPTVEGEIGILPGHIPLLTQVEHGELRVTKNGRTEWLAVGGGFAQVEGDRVSVLAEHAIGEEKIDESAVEAAL